VAPAVFGRGDPNPANSLWDGVRLGIVDLENAGWTDRAVDLADLVEHARLLAARRMFAFFWLALCLRAGQIPPPTVEPSAQLQRMRTLLTGS
jgi:thiamine kinase-like enzyme